MEKKGIKQSVEHIKKRLEARRNNGTYKVNEVTRQKMSRSFTGRKHTEKWKNETSKRMLETNLTYLIVNHA